MKAAGLTMADAERAGAVPHVVSMIGAFITATFCHHMFTISNVNSLQDGFVTGLGLGGFIAVPYMTNNILYGLKNKQLIIIDGGYAAFSVAVIGLVLNWTRG